MINAKPLPKKVQEYINKNSAFNMVGLLNLSLLRSVTNTRLSKKELVKRINKEFGKDFTGKIEFKGN